MAFETNLMAGIAQLIAGDGHGSWAQNGAYDPAQTGIYMRAMPEHAGNAIALSTYPLTDSPTLSDSTVGLQIRTRKDSPDPRDVDDLDEALFQLLHGLWGVRLSTGLFVTQCLRRSSTPFGQDGGKRWARSSNYALDVDHPSTHRTEEY